MYGANPINKQRGPAAVESAVDCPVCDAPAGHACVLFRDDWQDPKHENAEHAHNKRYVAAHVDYWKAHEGNAPAGRP